VRRAPLAGAASFADGTRGLCPLDSRWGLSPRPRDAAHPCLACGRDGRCEILANGVFALLYCYVIGCSADCWCTADRPAKSRAGRSG